MNPKSSLLSLLRLALGLAAISLPAAAGNDDLLPVVQQQGRQMMDTDASPAIFDPQNPGPRPEETLDDGWIPTYDCEGSAMCDTMALRWCDEAVNYHLQRQDDVLYGSSLPRVGACAGWATLGCAVFIQGDAGCNRTGNQIWWDYQDIRKIGHCTKCGTKHWYPGCMTTINYITWCTSDKVDHK